MSETFEIRPWCLDKVVLPQNTDHAGVMWHGSYLRWLEEARINALSSVGLAYSNLSNDGYEMPVVELNIKYLIPLLHGDQVLLKSWVSKGKGPRLHWETTFFKGFFKAAAVAKIDLVLIKKDNFESRLLRNPPACIQKALDKLHSGPNY